MVGEELREGNSEGVYHGVTGMMYLVEDKTVTLYGGRYLVTTPKK